MLLCPIVLPMLVRLVLSRGGPLLDTTGYRPNIELRPATNVFLLVLYFIRGLYIITGGLYIITGGINWVHYWRGATSYYTTSAVTHTTGNHTPYHVPPCRSQYLPHNHTTYSLRAPHNIVRFALALP